MSLSVRGRAVFAFLFDMARDSSLAVIAIAVWIAVTGQIAVAAVAVGFTVVAALAVELYWRRQDRVTDQAVDGAPLED